MKIIYKPLESLDKKQNVPESPRGRFDNMLSEHIRYTRGEVRQPLPQGDPKSPSSATTTNEGWATLQEADPEYYDKGVQKKTLAESFAARHGANLSKRINKYKHLVEAKAKKYDLDPNLLAGLIRQESNFNPYAVSHCGAMGLGQIMPETARYLGVKDPFNAAQNLDGCAKYLREQLDTFGGDVNKALAAYNAGPGAVKKYGGIPPYAETQNYVRAIRSHRSAIAEFDLFGKPAVTKKV